MKDKPARPADQKPGKQLIQLNDLFPRRNVQGGKGKSSIVFGSLPRRQAR